MRKTQNIIGDSGKNIPLHVKKFDTVAEYIAYIFNNASQFTITKGQPDTALVSFEELVAFGYMLGYNHGLDYMDGKRPHDAPIDIQYTEYQEGGE
jgi:hypothetical protein